MSTTTDQCIVLPLRPEIKSRFDGTGLALHFLLGNVLAMHPDLKEMWFGWRVGRIFPRQQALEDYCRDAAARLDMPRTAREQQVRFWIAGTCTDRLARLTLFDAESTNADDPSVELSTAGDDRLIGFRSGFIDWLAVLGRPMPAEQAQAALWPETIDRAGLDAVGRVLERFYVASTFGDGRPLEITPFKQAVDASPQSFMAHDLHGWALYRNRDYSAAKFAFLRSLNINPSGAGAMSGLMWCGVYTQDIDDVLFWSGRKADICKQDVTAAREAGKRRYRKVNG